MSTSVPTDESSTRMRTNAHAMDMTDTLTTEKSPSNLEKGAANGKENGEANQPDSPGGKKGGQRLQQFKHRVKGGHLDHVPTFMESIVATVRQSWLNLGLVFVILSWIGHFLKWNDRVTFILSFLALIPLEKLLQFCSHQSMLYLGHTVGDLVNITLMNSIEAVLAILLLKRDCSLKLLQGTIVGVILLQLLLVPGVAFVAGGSRRIHQELHASQTQLNQSMMTMGVMCLVIPASFFSGIVSFNNNPVEEIITNELRSTILKISRGMAIIMLLVYIASRIYSINPPGEEEDSTELYARGVHEAFREDEEKLKAEQPKISSWFCGFLLLIVIGLTVWTSECLVDSIEFVREGSSIQEEWFGLILLPLISFSGDGVVTFGYLFQNTFLHRDKEPHALADAKPIDLSIQFALFWTPFLILIGWWTDKPLPLLFDVFEVVILIASCFVVNYITADAKTNWAEGFTMICLYFCIALVAWFYPGQSFFGAFFGCIGHEAAGNLPIEGA